jgi:hypothetical protein
LVHCSAKSEDDAESGRGIGGKLKDSGAQTLGSGECLRANLDVVWSGIKLV